MPSIKGYEQQTNPAGMGVAPQARGEQFTSGMGEGLQTLSKGISNLEAGIRADELHVKQQDEKDAVAWSGKVLSDAHIQWSEQLLKEQEQAKDGAAGFTPKILTDFDKYSEETLKSAPTEAARTYLGERLTSLRTQLAGQALTFEAQSRRDYRSDQLKTMIDNNARTAMEQPANFTTLYAESKASIEAMDLPPQQKSILLDKLKTTLPYANVLGRVNNDPAGMARALGGSTPTPGSDGISGLRAKTYDASTFGKRPDGTDKGKGFLGVLQRPDGGVMTEYSVGVTINGKQMDVPTLVPTLTKAEVKTLLNAKDGERIPDTIVKKAADFARQRIADGKPVFAQDGEQTDIVMPATGGGDRFGTVMGFVFNKEGSKAVVDSNGYLAKFGINKGANPDVDVANLTKEQAAQLYKTRYWDRIGADHLSPGAALMAMDAAVNQGVPFAQEIIRKSGGDVDQMAALRREKYESLIVNSPQKYAQYRSNWMKRLDDATAQAHAAGGGSGVGNLDVANVQPDHRVITGDPAIDALSFEQVLQLRQHAETLANQQMALAREQLRGKMQDFQASAVSGKPIPDSVIPTQRELVAAHGETQGLAMYNEDVKPLLALNADLQTFSTKSVEERQALLRSRQPLPGEGFADASKRFEIMVKADEQLTKEMKDDPAAYSMKYSTGVKAAFDNLQKVPASNMAAKAAAAQQFVTATLAEQTRLGVVAPTILPKAITDSIVRQFYDQKDGGQNAALLMKQQADLWGKSWPQVYAQMAKDLPGSALVIGSGMKPQAAELLARASTMKQGELEDGLASKDVKTMKENLQGSMTDFMTSVTPLAGGAATFNTFSEQTTKLATMYMRAGESADAASKHAYDDVIGSKYNFVTNGNNKTVSYRVPKEFDQSTVAKGADRLMGVVEKMDLAVPPSLMGLDPQQAKTAFASTLKNQGYWVTANSNDGQPESGLALYVNGRAVTNSKGVPVFKTWSELANIANVVMPPRNPNKMPVKPTQQDFSSGNVYGAP